MLRARGGAGGRPQRQARELRRVVLLLLLLLPSLLPLLVHHHPAPAPARPPPAGADAAPRPPTAAACQPARAGHALVVGPWGEVVARCADPRAEGIAVADLDLGYVRSVRERMPLAEHRAKGSGALERVEAIAGGEAGGSGGS